MKSVLTGGGLLDEAGQPIPEPVRIFLEAKRGEALRQIFVSLEAKQRNQ